jgi:hypothetical protein
VQVPLKNGWRGGGSVLPSYATGSKEERRRYDLTVRCAIRQQKFEEGKCHRERKVSQPLTTPHAGNEGCRGWRHQGRIPSFLIGPARQGPFGCVPKCILSQVSHIASTLPVTR